MEWASGFWASLTLGEILLGIGLFIFSFAISIFAVGIVMVKIPADYFQPDFVPEFLPGKPWLVRWSAVIFKNVFGVALVLIGIVLSLPGVPGQGFLTILLGLIMLDIPGKKPIEAKIIKRPSILKTVNSLRAKYNKLPLEIN